MTYADIVHAFDCTDRHARRAIQKLREQGEVVADQDGRRNAWRLAVRSEREAIEVTASQALSLYAWRSLFDQLSGTHFQDDITELCAELQRSFQTKEQAALRRLDRKFYERAESRIEPGALRIDPRQLVTALLEEERIEAKHTSVDRGETAFKLDPLSLVAYKRLLYVVGRTSYHEQIRTLALTGFIDVHRLEGDRFEYPENYQPADHVETGFGIFQERETVRVRIRFSEAKADIVSRRVWHHSQKTEKHPDGPIDLILMVTGTKELDSWVLSWGTEAEVLEPASFRNRVADAHAKAAKMYGRLNSP